MKLTISQEEYLKTIYLLEKNNKKVRVTDIAEKMNITKPSVNRALKSLKELNLIQYEIYGNIELTKQGEYESKQIIGKQNILEIFLMGVLEIEKDKALIEANAIKSSMSNESIEKLDKYISKVLEIDNLKCAYNKENEKCRNCINLTKIEKIKNRGK